MANAAAASARIAWPRLPLLVLGFVGLFVGVGAGLARLGWTVPSAAAGAAALHGPLMICGFFGVVIALERAVAVGYRWAYAGPLFAGAGTIAALAGETAAAPWLFVAASLVLLAATLDVFRRQTALFTFTLVAGALAWTAGSALWATGNAVHAVLPWWLAFLVLTIAGERLELSRFLKPSPTAQRAFAAILAVIAGGLVLSGHRWGEALFAAGLLALALWLLKQDLARRTVRGTGLTRFIAVCLLSGYAWLATGAAIVLAAGGLAPGTPSYDAAVHALALGFVFSMVFGHAPIIFPAVLRVAVPYHPAFYVPLALLHLSLVVRLAGDAAGRFDWTRAGGLSNAVALAAFIVGTIAAVIRGARARRLPGAGP
ncbi:MAG TPA: hypothetical protein VET86_07830 [Casimicrobiaceae bacterium]|jgi:hypothetical protein|nr:hypothetical protein [Casimicrobiaceae bacterium]